MHMDFDLAHMRTPVNYLFSFLNLVLQCTIEHGFKDHRINLRIPGKNNIQLN